MTELDKEHRILVVDDDTENLSLLAGVLRNLYRVQVATDGKTAIELANTQPQPDLILLDVVMPEMDGHEVCRRLKAEEETKDIPVIFVTGHDDEEDETHGFALGAADYIAKPVRPALMRARIHTHLTLLERNRSLEALVEARTAQILEANQQLNVEKLEREQAMARIEHILGHDNLTRLPNRMRFLKTLSETITTAELNKRGLVVISVVIDQFGAINEKFGQDIGDRTLQEVAVRVMGIAGAVHLSSRTGPTTFALIIQGAGSNPGELDQRAKSSQEQLLRSLGESIEVEGQKVRVEARAGIARYPADGSDGAGLLKFAENACKNV